MRQLFEASRNVLNVDGKLYFFQSEPKVTTEPVLRPDSFVDGAGASCYGSILHDQGMFRMWYQAWPRCWRGENIAAVGYAESDDGLTWRKPVLNMIDIKGQGKDNNLCDLGFHSPSVFIDPDADADHRYRATGWTHGQAMGVPEGRPAPYGYYTAHSADGLHWALDDDRPTWDGSDVITSVYHPGRQAAVVALKHSPRMNGFGRRSIWNAFLKEGTWTDEVSALIPDEFDDICAISRGMASGDYYGMGMMPGGDQDLVGFIWQFRHNLPRTAGSNRGVFGVIDVSLAYQEKAGDRWLHFPGRPDFLSHKMLPWTRGGIYTASNVVNANGEDRLYFCGALESHAWYVDESWKVIEELKQALIDEGVYRIGYASWPENRLFGWRSDPEGSIKIRLPECHQSFEISLNFETETNGWLKAEVADFNNNQWGACSLENCDPLTGDRTNQKVTWQGDGRMAPTDKPMYMKITMKSARLYGYDCTVV